MTELLKTEERTRTAKELDGTTQEWGGAFQEWTGTFQGWGGTTQAQDGTIQEWTGTGWESVEPTDMVNKNKPATTTQQTNPREGTTVRIPPEAVMAALSDRPLREKQKNSQLYP